MLALVLILVAATPTDAGAFADASAPPLDISKWGLVEASADDAGHLPAPSTSTTPNDATPHDDRLSLANALGVMAVATATPVVMGVTTGAASLVILVAFLRGGGYLALFIVAACTVVGGLVGVPAGAELGVALFGDARDHWWVSLGATSGAAIGLLVAWTSSRAAAIPFDGAGAVGGAALLLGTAAGTGVVLAARHAELPELPWQASGALVVIGGAALGVGAAFSLLGPVSNDSRAGLDDAVAPTVMVLGAATLASGIVFGARNDPADVAGFLREPWASIPAADQRRRHAVDDDTSPR